MPTTYTQSGPVNMAADLLWQAAIDDQTGTFFQNFDENVDNLSKRSRETFKRVETGGKQSAAAVGILAGAVAGVTAKLVQMGLQGLQKFKALLMQATQLSARAGTLATSLQQVGNRAGYTDKQLEGFETAMKNNGITTVKTRESLLKMAQAQLDLSKSADLARVAQDAAVIAGTNSSEAFARIIHGITTLQPEILRGLGIIVDFQVEYKKAAEEQGLASAKMLDANMKQQIAMNAVLREGQRIYGTYSAAMETAGKQAGSLARHQEELMLVLGDAAQPAYLEWIQFQTRSLKEMREWFIENKDAVQDFGDAMGFLVGVVLDLVTALSSLAASKVPELFRLVVELLVNMTGEIDDMDERWDNLGTTAAQFATMAAGGLSIVATYVVETAKSFWQLYEAADAAWKLLSDPTSAVKFERRIAMTLQKFNDSIGTMGNAAEKAREAGSKTILEWSEGLGLIEEAAPPAEEAIDGVADHMENLAAETESAVDAITKLNAKIAEEMAEIAKKDVRDRIDREIRLSRRLEDMARAHAESIDGILKSAAASRSELIKDMEEETAQTVADQAKEREDLTKEHNRSQIDLEVEYQRTLQAIRQQFSDSADELARRNDAVGIARLQRQTKIRLRDAKKGKEQQKIDNVDQYKQQMEELKSSQEEQMKEIKTDAAQRLKDLDDNIEKRLAAQDESYRKSHESLQRSLTREAEDRARHRARADEDRREKHAAEIEALGSHLASLQSIDKLGLEYLLGQHGQYIASDLALWDAYNTARASLMAPPSGSGWTSQAVHDTESENMGYGGTYETSGDPLSDEWGFATGGIGIAQHQQRVTIAENGPEMIAAIPLNGTMSHNINVSDMNMKIQGVSPQMEQDLMPAMEGMLMQLATALSAGIANRRF